MKHTIGNLVARAAFGLALVVGLGGPTAAQITVTCWKEACVKSGDKTSCIREEIPCPPSDTQT